MSGDYYDPSPTVVLEEPVLLLGLPGSGVSQVARALCATTGLPFNDVERNAESIAGCSRAKLLLEDGLEAVRRVERRALRAALGRSPFGVVASEGVWPDEGERADAWLPLASVVYLRRPAEALHARLVQEQTQRPGQQPDFLIGLPRSPERLASYLAAREAFLDAAPIRIEAGDRHPNAIAQELRGSLDRIVGAQER